MKIIYELRKMHFWSPENIQNNGCCGAHQNLRLNLPVMQTFYSANLAGLGACLGHVWATFAEWRAWCVRSVSVGLAAASRSSQHQPAHPKSACAPAERLGMGAVTPAGRRISTAVHRAARAPLEQQEAHSQFTDSPLVHPRLLHSLP